MKDEPTDPIGLSKRYFNRLDHMEEYKIGALRSSGIYYDCVRKHVIGTRQKLMEKRFLRASDVATMSLIGTAVHEFVQNDPRYFGDRRIGWWECIACGEDNGFGPPPHGPCRKCGGSNKAIQYKEHFFWLPEYGVSGHPDMFLDLGGKFTTLEFKTCKPKSTPSYPGFDELAAPLIAHQWQLQTYLWALQQPEAKLPVRVERYGYIIYISKGHERDYPFKTFRFDWDDTLMDKVMVKLKDYKRGCAEFPGWLPSVQEKCLETRWGGAEPKKCPCCSDCQRFHGEGV